MTRTLVVFARVPERGQVKTRLAANIGDAAALALYEAFLDDTIATARKVDAELVLAVAGEGWTRGAHVPQPSGDLGARMSHFIDAYVSRGPVCIIGSDAPTLPVAFLERAFEELHEHQVVIGPSTDGGYWLIGARRPIPELFDDMPWSTSQVLEHTLSRLVGGSAALLDFFYDVDEPADLALLRAHLGVLPPAVAPTTRRVLATLEPQPRRVPLPGAGVD